MVFNPGHGVGLRNVGSYQISGHPYITGSVMAAGEEMRVSFPFVARDVTIINSGSATGLGPKLRVHFNSSSAGNVIGGKHYFDLSKDDASYTFETKCTEVYISCIAIDGAEDGFVLVANLTGIPAAHMYDLTGAGLTD
jgi:hypothetical protein